MMQKMKIFLKIGGLIFLFLFILTVAVKAQDAPDDTPIKVNTLLYTIPLTVSDGKGRPVSGLKKEDFSILEDGVKQEIEFFLNDETPMNVAILVDTSFSTKPVLDNIQKAARDFLKVLRPEDKGIIASFDYKTTFLSEFTSDKKRLSKAINQARIADRAGSDMRGAVALVVKNYFAAFKGRKAIIVLTDGMVSENAISSQEILHVLQNSDTLFYPIIFKTNFYSDARLRAANGRKPLPVEVLELLAGETAGRFYEKDTTNLKEAFQDIAEALKKQYLLGYYPQGSEKPTRLKIEVDRQYLTIQTKKNINF